MRGYDGGGNDEQGERVDASLRWLGVQKRDSKYEPWKAIEHKQLWLQRRLCGAAFLGSWREIQHGFWLPAASI